jgi:hypothetical protein
MKSTLFRTAAVTFAFVGMALTSQGGDAKSFQEDSPRNHSITIPGPSFSRNLGSNYGLDAGDDDVSPIMNRIGHLIGNTVGNFGDNRAIAGMKFP